MKEKVDNPDEGAIEAVKLDNSKLREKLKKVKEENKKLREDKDKVLKDLSNQSHHESRPRSDHKTSSNGATTSYGGHISRTSHHRGVGVSGGVPSFITKPKQPSNGSSRPSFIREGYDAVGRKRKFLNNDNIGTQKIVSRVKPSLFSQTNKGISLSQPSKKVNPSRHNALVMEHYFDTL